VTVYPLVDSNRNPKLKQKILNGEFFVRHCSNCDEKMMIWHDTMYQDHEKGFLIYLTNDVVEISKTMEWTRDEKNIGHMPEDTRIRIVQNQNQLKEKLNLFEYELDDRVIELIKLQLLDVLDNIPAWLKDVLCWVKKNGDFEFTLLGDEVDVVGVRRQAYAMMLFKYVKQLAKANKSEVQIDMEWANDIMANYECEEE
jgi:hypothetical protein